MIHTVQLTVECTYRGTGLHREGGLRKNYHRGTVSNLVRTLRPNKGRWRLYVTRNIGGTVSTWSPCEEDCKGNDMQQKPMQMLRVHQHCHKQRRRGARAASWESGCVAQAPVIDRNWPHNWIASLSGPPARLRVRNRHRHTIQGRGCLCNSVCHQQLDIQQAAKALPSTPHTVTTVSPDLTAPTCVGRRSRNIFEMSARPTVTAAESPGAGAPRRDH